MTLEPPSPPYQVRPALELGALQARLLEHVGRTRRNGGFLSVVALRFPDAARERFDDLSIHIRRRMRGHDLAGHSGERLILVLPDTDMRQAQRAAHPRHAIIGIAVVKVEAKLTRHRGSGWEVNSERGWYSKVGINKLFQAAAR